MDNTRGPAEHHDPFRRAEGMSEASCRIVGELLRLSAVDQPSASA
ncbi:hypothetical protein [Corynebacterium variabile]